MRCRGIVPMVFVRDMDRALGFYRDVLDLSVQAEEEDWVIFTEGMGLMLSPEPLPEENWNLNSVMLSLNVDDVHASYHELTARGVAFFIPPTEVGTGLVASFRDTEGNLLQIVQSLA